MMVNYIPCLIVAVPALVSLISLFPDERVGRYTSIVGASLLFLLSFHLFIGHGGYHNSWIYLDFVARAMLVIISLTYLLAVLHSSLCISEIDDFYLPPNYYWVLLALFALTMLLAVSTPNLGYAWFWLETSTIVSAALILLERGKAHIESAWRYLLIASTGLGIALLSVLLFGWATGGFIWVNAHITSAATLMGTLALLGFGAKAGLFPVHTWLPDAHGTAPSPVSAMLSGALLPSALIVYYRVFSLISSSVLANLTIVIGLLTLWVAGILMVPQKHLKRLLAYSSMDVMGIATVGIGLSMYADTINYVLLIFLAHAIGKTSLFLAAGVLKRKGYTDIPKIRNLLSSPVLASAVVISALTVTGAPPFPLFFGEFGLLATSAFSSAILVLFLAGVLLSFLALNYHIIGMLFDREDEGIKIDGISSSVAFGAAMLSILVSAIIIYLYLGWYP